MDYRQEEAEYYPGGADGVRPTPKPDEKPCEGLEVRTNTIPDLRRAMKEVARLLGATIVSVWAICAMANITVTKQGLNDFELDEDPQVVTDVTADFGEYATTNDVAAAKESAKAELAAATNALEQATLTRIDDIETRFVSASNAFEVAMQEARGYVDEQIQSVYRQATGYADGILNTATANVERVAAMVASNTVETVLAPKYLEFECDGESEQAFVAPNWAMSPFHFKSGADTNDWTGTRANIYSNGPLRNYSVLFEELPDDEFVRRYGAVIMDFTPLTNNIQRVYATPAFEPVDWEAEDTPPELCRCYGWRVTTNDIPCLVSLRQPEASTIIVTLQRLGKAPLEEKIHDALEDADLSTVGGISGAIEALREM